MADKKRSELLQEQIGRLMTIAPKPYTAAEEAEIKRGRKGQKDIDAGRATVEQRNQEVREFNKQIEALNSQLDKAMESEQGAAETARVNEQAAAKEAEKRSPFGVGAQVASGIPSAAAGYGLGRLIGGGITREADEGQAMKNESLRKVAQDRISGLTTREGARIGVERAGAMPRGSAVGRFVSRAGAPTAIGGLMAGKGLLLAGQVDEEDPLLNQAVDQGFAMGMVGGGVGLAEKGLQYGFNPKVSPDASALSIIESNQLRRGGLNQAVNKGPLQAAPSQPALPGPSQPSGPMPGSKEHLREQARALGAKVTTRMTKEELGRAIAAKATEAAGRRARAPKLPKGTGAAGIAGGLAYAMTPDGAQAADGSQGSNQGQALTNAGIAGGTAYGVSKGLGALGPVAKTVMTGAGEAMAPLAIDSMTDYSPAEQLQGRVMLGEYLPEALQSAPIQQAHQMAQVPSRNPARPVAFDQQGNDAEFQAALQAFLQNYEADNGSPEGMAAEAY